MRQEEWLVKLDELVKEDIRLFEREEGMRDRIHNIWKRHYPRCSFCGTEGSVRLVIWNSRGINVVCEHCQARTPLCKDVIEATYLWDAMTEAQETLNALKDNSA